MNKIYSIFIFVAILALAGCDNTIEPIAQESQTSQTMAERSSSKRGGSGGSWNNGGHDRNCDRDHDRDDDCNSKEGDHDRDCDRYHQRDNDRCNDDREHSSGCRKNHDYNESCTNGGGGGTDTGCDSDGIVTLWAGKSTNVGTVTVTQDAGNIYVKYQVSGYWKLKESHLDIATTPFTERGAPGQYDYQATHASGTTTYTYTVAKTWDAGTKLYFLAHAVVGKSSGSYNNNCGSTETAYGGTVVKPRSGSWYATFCFTLQGTPPPPTYAINGTAFVDANSNGTQDAGETGLANVPVSLSTGATAVTSASGAYSFGGLLAGTYTVSVSAVSGYTQTTASSAAVTLTSSNGSADFGYAEIPPPPPTFTVSGYVFLDLNTDGVRDAGEIGIPGITVTLNETTTFVTGSDGFYSFSGLDPMTYSVIAFASGGYNPTMPNVAKVIITAADGSANFGFTDAVIPDSATQKPKAH